jgi:malate dehydrogenase
MVESILRDSHDVHPTCAWVSGEYGISDTYLGVPAKLGAGGVTGIVELELNDDERSQLEEAASAIRVKCEELAARRK